MSAGQDFETRPGDAVADEVVAPLPRITLQAFCETPAVAATMQAAIADAESRRDACTVPVIERM